MHLFNHNYEYHEFPFPHIVIKDFIKDPKLADYMSNNKELPKFFGASGHNMMDLERTSIFASKYDVDRFGVASNPKYSSHLPNDFFDEEFNNNVQFVLQEFTFDFELIDIFAYHFNPVLESEYENFSYDWSWKTIQATYGAYNGTSVAKNIIGWHRDRGNKVLSGFVYFREKDDNSADSMISLTSGENMPIKEYPYVDNMLVIWPNVKTAWHRVGVRYPTVNLRRFINLMYVTQEGQKDLHDYSVERLKDKNLWNHNELYPEKDFGFRV